MIWLEIWYIQRYFTQHSVGNYVASKLLCRLDRSGWFATFYYDVYDVKFFMTFLSFDWCDAPATTRHIANKSKSCWQVPKFVIDCLSYDNEWFYMIFPELLLNSLFSKLVVMVLWLKSPLTLFFIKKFLFCTSYVLSLEIRLLMLNFSFSYQ